eukprot:TRINITY_DN1592_c0_g1_i1.p1 TRINITY_DN1592_c0_g1~~TRINITY_DN1592_c0_g1_i1.p1  ORF type:complete len:311 (+),score=38.73 TRINITY_DN1592_c0_g1_i1:91-1023(+)
MRLNSQIHQEFSALNYQSQNPKNDYYTATNAENVNRNRYTDVLPNEETRVKISQSETDYINANLITSNTPTQFICAQAPLPSTFKDFWGMVWQQNCPVICTLNRLEEKGKKKGDVYWPISKDEPLLFGDLSVSLESKMMIQELSTEVRVIRIESTKYKSQPLKVYQLHFLGWSDYGVPSSTVPIRELVRLIQQLKIRAMSNGATGPCVVHCSAGIGRAGTFLAIFMVLESQIYVNSLESADLRNFVKYYKKMQNGLKESLTPGYYIDTTPMEERLDSVLCTFPVSDIVGLLRRQRNEGMVSEQKIRGSYI